LFRQIGSQEALGRSHAVFILTPSGGLLKKMMKDVPLTLQLARVLPEKIAEISDNHVLQRSEVL
jgi:hypothetical protein